MTFFKYIKNEKFELRLEFCCFCVQCVSAMNYFLTWIIAGAISSEKIDAFKKEQIRKYVTRQSRRRLRHRERANVELHIHQHIEKIQLEARFVGAIKLRRKS